MIVSLYLRHFKIYKGINFIPLSFGKQFSSVIGENGVGKSSILEALDFALNKKEQKEWPVNNEAKSEGNLRGANYPFVAPIFLIKKSIFRQSTVQEKELFEKAGILSKYFWETTFKTKAKGLDEFYAQRDVLKLNYDQSEYYLILIGKKHYDNCINFGSFHTDLDFLKGNKSKIEESKIQEYFEGFYDYITSHYSYMHIPVETDPQQYTKLETTEMQKLMDKDIQTEIENAITKKTINQINNNLDAFVKEIENTLGTYKYKGHYKNSLTMPDLVSKIIEAYFSIKILNKKGQNEKLVPVYDLSSGEKRKALIDIAYSFLIRNHGSEKIVLLAIDEPEASLHISACFPQFERLMELSNLSHQVIISTHWYGYLPIVSKGSATSITKAPDNTISINHFDLYNYREQITQDRKAIKGPLPFDINLKSYNDLVQSIVVSILSEPTYNWIVCEGLSEKVYFEVFFKKEIEESNLKILPVGGYKDVKKVYDNLIAPINDSDYIIKGRVFCLIDTDDQTLNIDYKHNDNLMFKRLLNNANGCTELVDVNSNKNTPPTEIEDCLVPNIYIEALRQLSFDNQDIQTLIDENPITDNSLSSHNCMDLRPSDLKKVSLFFDEKNGENKVLFAKKYIEVLDGIDEDDQHELPWVREIKEIFNK